MAEEGLKVLAVADPAVAAYTDSEKGLLSAFACDVSFDTVVWDNYYSTMLDAFSGKAEYDIVMIAGHLWLADFAGRGCLSELPPLGSTLLPGLAGEMDYQGKTYLSPSFFDGHIITYRKSRVREAIGKELPPVITPQEFIETAKALHELDGKPSIALKADPSEIFTDALPFLRMNGKDVYDEKGSAMSDCPEVIEGLEQYVALKKLAVPGTEHFGNGEIADAIRENKAPLITTWSGQMGVVFADGLYEPEDLGFSTFSTAWSVTWSFAVLSSSKKQELAKDFLAFLRTPEIDLAAGEVSGAPVQKASYERGEKNQPWFLVQQEMVKRNRPLPMMQGAGDKHGVFYEEITKAFAGEKTAAEAMVDAEKRINQ